MQWTVWADHLLQFCLYETGKGLNSWFVCYHLPDNEHWVLIFLSIFVLLLLQNKWNVSYCKVSLTTWWSYGLQMNDRPANMLLSKNESLYWSKTIHTWWCFAHCRHKVFLKSSLIPCNADEATFNLHFPIFFLNTRYWVNSSKMNTVLCNCNYPHLKIPKSQDICYVIWI